jgi:hypothetical protein
MSRLAFCDTEAFGLIPERHPIWEVGLILATHEDERLLVESERSWFIEPPLGALQDADPMALHMTRFYERTRDVDWDEPERFAVDFAWLTGGRSFAGAVPSFDDLRLGMLLRRYDVAPAWHYHLICVENLAVGALAERARVAQEQGALPGVIRDMRVTVTPPWNHKELLVEFGVELDAKDEHTALGDARAALQLYAAVHGLRIPPTVEGTRAAPHVEAIR